MDLSPFNIVTGIIVIVATVAVWFQMRKSTIANNLDTSAQVNKSSLQSTSQTTTKKGGNVTQATTDNVNALLAEEDAKNKKKKNKKNKKNKSNATVSLSSIMDGDDDGDVIDSDDEEEIKKQVPSSSSKPKSSSSSSKSKGKKENNDNNKSSKSKTQKDIKGSSSTTTPSQPTIIPAVEAVLISQTTTTTTTTTSATAPAAGKKKKNQNKKASTDTPTTTTTQQPPAVQSLASIEKEVVVPPANKPKSPTKAPSAATSTPNPTPPPTGDEGWSTVGESKMKAKKERAAKKAEAEALEASKKAAVAAAALAASVAANAASANEPAPAPVIIDSVTQLVAVDAKKLGRIIGPKGKTLNDIQDATASRIDIPKPAGDKDDNKKPPATTVQVTVTGPAAGVPKAVRAIEDLCSKGYSKLIAGEDFSESSIHISSRCRMELMGNGAKNLRALQTKCEVKLQVHQPKDGVIIKKEDTTKLTIAGKKDDVNTCKAAIKEISQYYHHELTHPGAIHSEVDVPPSMYNLVIGSKGSEIKHIQANFKVGVYIPQADSIPGNDDGTVTGVLVVGQPTGVSGAVRYIAKIVETNLAKQQEEEAPVEESDWPKEEEEVQPQWMDQFDYAKLRAQEDALVMAAAKEVDAVEISPPSTGGVVNTALPTPQEAWIGASSSTTADGGWSSL